MRRSLILSVTLVLAVAIPTGMVEPALAGVPLDRATEDYLEGAWLLNEKPAQGSCTAHIYDHDEIEFEFRRSGGRMIIYQKFDLFSAAGFSSAEMGGDVLTATIAGLNGKPQGTLRLRLLPPDRVEVLSEKTGTADGPASIAYRCAPPDRNLSQDVPDRLLSVLTWPKSGTAIFVEPGAGMSDAETCNPSGSGWRRWLQFEVIGPVHAYVLGKGFDSKFDLSPIRSVRALDGHRLAIDLQEWRHDRPPHWEAGARAKTFTLTADWDGRRLHIPELDAQFVRCFGTPATGFAPAPLPLDE